MQGQTWVDLDHAQRHFDAWRPVYNRERPHQALDWGVPGSRYHFSERRYVAHPPPPEYGSTDKVRRVQRNGRIGWNGNSWKVGKAFAGEHVAIRPSQDDGQYDVFWSTHRIARIDRITGTVNAGRLPA